MQKHLAYPDRSSPSMPPVPAAANLAGPSLHAILDCSSLRRKSRISDPTASTHCNHAKAHLLAQDIVGVAGPVTSGSPCPDAAVHVECRRPMNGPRLQGLRSPPSTLNMATTPHLSTWKIH